MNYLMLEALIKANKLGARGMRVVGYKEPQSAGDDPSYILITERPTPPASAGDLLCGEKP